MGNCVSLTSTTCATLTNISKKNNKGLPIETTFKLPSPIPTWPPGEGFGSGTVDLGGLKVCQISSFERIWATHEGAGATFFEPAAIDIPQGYFMLGCYAQPNNTPLFGRVLAAKDDSSGLNLLKKPVDYTLVWSSESLKIKQDGIAYIWLPTSPDGYRATGHVITNSPVKPPLDKMRCVRSDFTVQCQTDKLIWGQGNDKSNASGYGLLEVFSVRPSMRGTKELGVSVGTFAAQINGQNDPRTTIYCLKNMGEAESIYSSMPNPRQIEAILEAYSPYIYMHPDEKYVPSSVSWFFNNGALLYKKGEELKPIPIESTGSNLPQGGTNDGAYWLDLPVDEKAKERVKKGDLQSAEVYLHIKPMLGATYSDIAIWMFYPFNGPARVKVEFVNNIPLGKIGEHVGDWEHVTLRISNFNGELWRVYFSQHSGGTWVNASELEFVSGSNKAVAYSSLNGHAMYAKPGLVLQGSDGIGIRNDTAKSKMVLDTGRHYSIVAADYDIDNHDDGIITDPPSWLNYFREWGPKITYDIADEIKKFQKLLPGNLKSAFQKFVNALPNEVLGEEGPTGPKAKSSWNGDEV